MRTKKDTLGNIQIHDTQRAIKYTVSPHPGVGLGLFVLAIFEALAIAQR
ncbi:MAG: hypothetical protein KME31_07930 [Tolypothrix carrinoi HA7290-LM1]|nr:hypothetical protein [Tolypothrix carrinoi HA7290-LM1]